MKKALLCCLSAIMVMTSTSFAFAAVTTDNLALTGVFTEKEGVVLAVEQEQNRIINLAKDGSWKTISGKSLVSDIYGEATGGYLDGANAYALYNKPTDIVKYVNGYAVSDTENNVIRYFTSKVTRTLSGSGKAELQDGTAEGASFNRPTGLAVDEKNNLYIADTGNDAIRMMDDKGKVKTVVTGLCEPRGLAWMNGALYIADAGNQRILKYIPAEEKIYTFAGDTSYRYSDIDGNPVAGGYVDGKVTKARFSNPVGLAADPARNIIFVGDCGNNAIRMIRDNEVSTIIKADALNLDSFPSEPTGLCYLNNKLYVADANYGYKVLELGNSLEKRGVETIFSDVVGTAWYKDAVDYAYSHNIFQGTSENTFSPQESMTRGMFVTVVARLYQQGHADEIINGNSSFSDVAIGKYYANNAAWAADNGIVSGVGGNMFAPNNAITRQQMAVVIYNYVKACDGDLTVTDGARKQMNGMPDSAELAGWAKEATAWAMAHGIIKGKDGKLAPNATATRAEVAQIVYNLAESNVL